MDATQQPPRQRATHQRGRPGRRARDPRVRLRRHRLAATAIAVVVIGVIGSVAVATWLRPAPLEFPSIQHARDSSPVIGANIGDGRAPAEGSIDVEVNGKSVPAAVHVAGRKVSIQLPELIDGRHDVRIRAASSVPSIGERTYRSTVVVDTANPSLNVGVSQQPNPQGGTRVVLRVSTQPGSRVELTTGRDDETLGAKSGVATHTMTLPEGRHEIDLRATDPAGNIGIKNLVVWVDATPPQVQLPPELGVFNVSRPELRANVSDNRPLTDASARATIDGRAATARIGTTGLLVVTPDGPQSEGDHELRLTLEDAAGNAASVTRAFNIDSTESLGEAKLRTGATGADVRLLQHELSRPSAWTGSPPQLAVTGTYDGATAEDVERFQSQEALSVDGVAGPFTIAALTLRISIDKSSHSLVLYRYGKAYRTYSIAVGQPKYPTPTGEFRIVDKQKNPTWTPPDSEWARDAKVTPPGPDNPLGTRWMGLDAPSIGIHGTNSPQSLGYSVSHGCIRMSIADVEELFDIVEEGTRVEIRS